MPTPPFMGKSLYFKLIFCEAGGAQGRNRTTDTAIFSRMLYQLSYLGAGLRVWSGGWRVPNAAGSSGL